MATVSLKHDKLNATFVGAVVESHGEKINVFRGIKYASIPGRFELSKPVDDWEGKEVDATKYGPRCPQVDIDVRHLLRLPEDFKIEDEPEDEFECLNLEIACPANISSSKLLPVLFWIYGGSQIVTYCSGASKICDTTRIVADSIKAGKPIIVVSINYRLNIFKFGDGKEKNLDVKDQRLGIEWVKKYIAGFGGDPDNITLAGESAGAIYVHVHTITGPPVKRAVLASGSLYLSSPLPVERGDALIKNLEAKTQEFEGKTLREASVPALLKALTACNVNTMWLQEEAELENWESRPEQVDELMIGDVEYESVIWRNGVELLDGQTITAAFEQNPEWGTKLRKLYHVVPDRPTACKLGALDLVNDARYTLPVELISEKVQAAKKSVYRYVIDQPNPFQPSSRAHHAVDLLFLFGGVDLSHNPSAEAVGQELRNRWIQFINGEAPWPTERRFAFGPLGECKEIDEEQFAARRRVPQVKALKEAGTGVYLPIVFALTAGRISLLN
ncbi:hypothetical protein DTO195F2_2697 [Paecilomyces variotii]|nr:hypothetical protein DTO195F2_2697 [Paecilomyces variotii]KAJ9370288.1 hypothetical protein DTO282E5_4997 [Paecilomyces variotii]KAJ9397307.1 hypothetical protein DTO282F9_5747 [Paecilomyces variotii]